jgi:hypothetical protein
MRVVQKRRAARLHRTTDGRTGNDHGLSDWDRHAIARKGGTRYTVQTVSLNDLLRHHGAPKTIDYLSIEPGLGTGSLECLRFLGSSRPDNHGRTQLLADARQASRFAYIEWLHTRFRRIFGPGRLVPQARFVTCCPADPFQIETNCGSGSDSNARVPYPSDCFKSNGNPRGFENWT